MCDNSSSRNPATKFPGYEMKGILETCAETSNETNQQEISHKTQIRHKSNIPDRESFQRINYLFQAAQLVSSQSPRARSVSVFYGSIINSIAQKSLIRLHPNLKRVMCRGCKGLLLPGVTTRISVKSRPCCQVVWTCDLCGTIRRMPARRGYRLWIEKSEAIVSHNH